MKKTTSLLLLLAFAMSASMATALMRETRTISTRLSRLHIEREVLRIDRDAYRIQAEMRATVIALIETFERFDRDGAIDIEAWRQQDQPWEVSGLDYGPGYLQWELRTRASALRNASSSGVEIDGKRYFWPHELADEVLRYRLEDDCVFDFSGRTRAEILAARFEIFQFKVLRGCRMAVGQLD